MFIDEVVQHGSQEEELRNSYNPTNIRKLVKQLLSRLTKFQVLQLSDKVLPAERNFFVLVHVLLHNIIPVTIPAKSRMHDYATILVLVVFKT